MPFPLVPLAIMAGAKIAGGLLKKKGQIKAAKEEKKAADANLQAQYESGLATEGNREDDRLARMQFLGGQLKGARALSPEVLQAALKRRASAVRKGVAMDKSKGMGWGAAGDVAGQVGELAGSYIKGAGMPQGAPEGMSSQFMPGAGGGSPVSMGGQVFDFFKKQGDF